MNVKTKEDVLMTIILVVAVRQGVWNATIGAVYVALSWKKCDYATLHNRKPS
jgi:hypothetical protein